MKIAQIVCTFPPYRGGMGNAAEMISSGLAHLGADVTVFTPDYGYGIEAEKGFKVEYLKSIATYGNAAVMWQILNKLKDFDILYLHYPFFGTAELVAIFKLFHPRMKLVVHYHMDVTGLSFFAKILSLPDYLLRPALLSQSNLVIASSFDYLDHSDISLYYKLNKKKFLEVPFGVDVERFKPKEKSNSKVRLLFVGGLDQAHYFKGLSVLIEAVRFIDGDFELIIVGSGGLRSRYETEVARFGLSDKVTFKGSLPSDELREEYASADLLILPSVTKGEAFGIVLIEAMSSGMAVIASDLPGVRTVFQDGTHGYLAKPGEALDLRIKIQSAISDRARLESMGKAARAFVLERYLWTNIVKKLYTELEKLLCE